MKDCPLLGDVNLLTPKHGVNSLLQPGLTGQLKEQRESFVGDAVFRVIEIKSYGISDHALAPAGIRGEQIAKMEFADFLVMSFESFPRGTFGEWCRCGRHIQPPYSLKIATNLSVWPAAAKSKQIHQTTCEDGSPEPSESGSMMVGRVRRPVLTKRRLIQKERTKGLLSQISRIFIFHEIPGVFSDSALGTLGKGGAFGGDH
jgi:hypothetical protein